MKLDGIKLRLRNAYIRKTANFRSKNIDITDFTIISNNCWGGLVYESYNLPKQSPTIGMFFIAEEYIKFLSNLKYYTTCEMKFVDPEKSRHKDFYAKDSRFGSYPIAILDDVEIALLHYHSKEEAKLKWERRCKRINWDHLLIKMNDQNQCSEEHIEEFLRTPFSNKVFFTVRKKYSVLENVVYIKSKNTDCCGLFDEPYGASRKYDVNTLIKQL